MDAASGHPLALIDGEAITLRRTAAASALASLYLSRPDARTLLVVGPGRLAPYMAAAHCAVRPIERALVWGRDRARAEAMAAALHRDGCPAEPCAELGAGLAVADIVTCATTAREPVVRGALVRPGTHVDLVGAFTPEMRESDDELIATASVFVDTRAGALGEAGDLLHAIDAGAIGREHVRAELAELCTGRHAGRQAAGEITVFKSVGTALEDLCAARLVYERGRQLPGMIPGGRP
jgi:ornithine cyclodeaminase